MIVFRSSWCLIVVSVLVSCSTMCAKMSVAEEIQTTVQTAQRQAHPEALRQWQHNRFGMFIHWGPISLKGTEIGWSRDRELPSAEYDQLYKKFNPKQFDAERWVRVAKEAGMNYVVITAKHHDGFCLWPSKYTDYDIAATPLQRDVLKELADACREHGLVFCTYFSICDWYHPDYPLGSPGGKSTKPNPDMSRYNAYLKNQTKEILNNYGPLGTLWFDGEWESPWTREYGNELYDYVRQIQPTLIVNNRVSKGRQGMAGTTQQSDLNAGDFDTPEQRIGGFSRKRPWETCMTIGRQWAWKPNDKIKTTRECIQTLLYTIGGDGNLLLNVGPMPDGRIEPRQVQRLTEMGAWLKPYGQGVYGTRGGPFKPGTWGASTCRSDKIYLYVMNWPGEGPLQLPPIDKSITSARPLSCKQLTIRQTTEGINIDVPDDQRDKIATVIELTVHGRSYDVQPVDVNAAGEK